MLLACLVVCQISLGDLSRFRYIGATCESHHRLWQPLYMVRWHTSELKILCMP